jgi:predicted AAA+ superfamily ATPase
MYYTRMLSESLKKATETFPVVLLTGPRQTGKTTHFEHGIDGIRSIVSMDNPGILAAAKKDPALFFKTYTPPLLIDEVQYAPELFPYIKLIADREKKSGLFWLTGSHIFRLMRNVRESLAGRAAVLSLQGFSQAEKRRMSASPPFLPSFALRKDIPSLSLNDAYTLIWRGSFPRLIAGDDEGRLPDWKLFYDSYIATYIEKDIRFLANIVHEHNFMQFLKLIAARSAQLLNYSDLARDVGVAVNTVKSWISLLETTGIVYLLYPYSNNMSSRLVKTPKLYFLDTGLACYLAGWESPELLAQGSMAGAILETYVVSEVLKSYWHNGERPNLYFYRDKNMREIDIIIEKNGALHPVEVKRSASPGQADIRHFDVLKSLGRNIGPGAVICLVDNPIPLGEDVVAMPLTYL